MLNNIIVIWMIPRRKCLLWKWIRSTRNDVLRYQTGNQRRVACQFQSFRKESSKCFCSAYNKQFNYAFRPMCVLLLSGMYGQQIENGWKIRESSIRSGNVSEKGETLVPQFHEETRKPRRHRCYCCLCACMRLNAVSLASSVGPFVFVYFSKINKISFRVFRLLPIIMTIAIT